MQFKFRLTNNTQEPMTVVREPWGDWYELPKGQSLRVVASGPLDPSIAGLLEVVVAPGRVEVYGWSGSIVEMSVETP